MSDGRRAHHPMELDETEVSEPGPAPGSSQPTLPGVGAPEPTLRERSVDVRGPIAAELRPGDHVGRYVIERQVGAGGMGEVYAAHDPQLDRRVAIKVLRPSGRAVDAAARLVREAQALAKLAHPNVVAVHDVGEADGRVFLAMQFVEGTTLAEHLARNRVEPEEIVRMYVAAGRGLAAAHAAGLVHRDVKPSNVLVDREGRVAVTDFGVARASDDFATPEPHLPSWSGPRGDAGASQTGRSALSTDMTQAGAVIGTPSYMAPEQHAGQRATAKSDQFGFCVSLWQGLFGKHPFIPDDHDEVTSPFEYMAYITDGVLVPPRKGHGVPRRIVAALGRGLAKSPDARWPSMNALLAELEPRSGTRTAVIALAATAALGTGAALWLGLAERPEAGPSCAAQAAERARTAWSPARQASLREAFAATGRSYGAVTADAAGASLDRYAQRWSALAADACAGAAVPASSAAPAASSAAAPLDGAAQLAVARAQCLDRSLGALRSVATMMIDGRRGEVVDNALQVVAGLPDLDDCVDPAALLATGAPPPAQAAVVAALEERLATARAAQDSGLFREAEATQAALVTEADAAGWAPLRVRARLALGESKVRAGDAATPLLLEAARLAVEHDLDREATRAWTLVMLSASLERVPDAVDAYTHVARAAAAATRDPELANSVRIAYGRALIRLRRHAQAEPECRAALEEARARGAAEWRELVTARDCMLELLAPLGKWAEAVAIAEESMADRSALIGAEHPAVADYLTLIARVKRSQGKVAEAKLETERARDIRERAFGKRHLRYAESLEDLAWFEKDQAKRRAILEEALAIASDPATAGPRTPSVQYAIERGLADVAQRAGDYAAMQRHFERAIALAGQLGGPRSLDVGMLLVGYGQYMSRVDLAQSLAKLRLAVEILEELRDKRAEIARGALALILLRNERWAEALPHLEKAMAALDVENTEPFNLAMMRLNLADALVHTGGDRARARALALQARDAYRVLDPEDVGNELARAEKWLKKYR